MRTSPAALSLATVPRAAMRLTDQPAERPATSVVSVRDRYANGRVRVAKEMIRDASGSLILHGEWKLLDQNGKVKAHGHYHQGRRHGVWNRWYEHDEFPLARRQPYASYQGPYISQALFDHGRLHGYWIIFDAQHRKISQFVFLNGQRHGASTWWHSNGTKMQELYYRDGLPHGLHVKYDEQGKLTYRARYRKGVLSEEKTEHYANGQRRASGNVVHPPLVLASPDDWWNARFAGYHREGGVKKIGLWKKWHRNGELAVEGSYEDGRPNGEFEWFFDNGRRESVGSYLTGKPSGVWKWWDRQGQFVREQAFSSEVADSD